MQKTIAILEVSKKQDYIFRSRKLKDNAMRSVEIAYVTSNEFFEEAAEESLYREKENFVYSGGGHTVLQFESREKAKEFIQIVTEKAMREFEGLEIFAKLMDVKEKDAMTPGEILKELSKRLEQKKSKRKDAFRYTAFGIEALDSENYIPRAIEDASRKNPKVIEKKLLEAPEGKKFADDFEKLIYDTREENPVADDNFLAVIHIDGNAMGAKVDVIYQKERESWERCCESLRAFSKKIQEDFEQSFLEMVQEVMKHIADDSDVLPVRPVILAGDDVCFVTAGCIGLECARIFLEKLSQKQINGEHYAACAGVAMVHRKYPFHLAYDLAEELCSNAKKFGAVLDGKSRVSAIDWHIEFGQMKDGLEEIREEYQTEDGNRLELRPAAVVYPPDCRVDAIREYNYFKTMCKVLQTEKELIARGKMKEWRTALKQGEVESEYFIHTKEIDDILYKGFDAEFRTDEEKKEQFERILNGEEIGLKDVFRESGGVKRSLFFDAIEMMDHAVFF